MTFLADHFQTMATLVLMAIGLVATWTKMRDKLDALHDQVTDNRKAMEKASEDFKETLSKDMVLFRNDHDRTRAILSTHISDFNAHTSPQERDFRSEWRRNVIDRLERIETTVIDIKQNGGIK